MAQPSSFPRCFRVLLTAELLTSLFLLLFVSSVAAQSSSQRPFADQPEALRPLDTPHSFSPTQSDSYVLGPGDTVRLDVFRIPEYSGEFEVLVNGVLSLPMVGQVAVSGMTLEEASVAISGAYAQRLRRPIVNLYLIAPRPLEVGIAGEVSHPGSYVLEREGTQFPTLISALEAAGGVTQSADLRQVVIQRVRPDGSKQTLPTDLWQFLQTGDLRYNIALRDGDTIQIPPRESFDHQESLQIAAASFAADESQPLNIAVVGEVFRPGPYTVTGSARTGEAGVPGGSGGSNTPPTVTRAIQVAGGVKPEANIRDITVYRRTRDGEERGIGVNLWQLLADGDITEDIVLQEGDTVYVPQAETLLPAEVAEIATASFSPDTIRINVVGEVDRPGVKEVPPNTPLSQGILAAGGFDDRRASQGAVDLIRLNPDGTATRSSIEVDFSEGIDEDINPLLRNNDIIIVRRSTSASLADALDTIAVPLGRAFSLFTLPLSILNLFE